MSATPTQPKSPLYFRIQQVVLERIQAGQFKPGAQLPTEADLARQYQVSRITAKRALDELVRQGRAYRQQGRGTFVAQARIRDISGFRSFSEDIRARGFSPTSQVLDFKEVEPDAVIRERLHTSPGERVILLKRLRLADQEPVAVETAYLPCRLCPGLLQEDLALNSLYAVLAEKYNRVPTWADAEIEAVVPDKEQARLLKLMAGTPVLVARRVTYAADYDVIETVDFGLPRRPLHLLYRPPIYRIRAVVMDLPALKHHLHKGLIVSCQALPGEPLFGAGMMAGMARAAVSAGAVAIRANGPEDIAAIRAEVQVPIIGIYKADLPGFEVRITPTIEHALQVAEAGADMIALDATLRPHPKSDVDELIEQIQCRTGLPVLADISTLKEGLTAAACGAEFVGTTLSGYTSYSPDLPGPDFALLSDLVAALGPKGIPVIAEGRIATPEQAARALALGAHAVVVGSAITRPQWITARFMDAINGAGAAC